MSIQQLLVLGMPLAISMAESFSNVSGSSPVTVVGAASGRGGIGSYTYAWTWDVPGSPAITITNPNTAGPTFSAVLGPDESTSGTVRCTVTDSIGNTVFDTALVSLTRLP